MLKLLMMMLLIKYNYSYLFYQLWLVPTDLSKFIEDQFNENVDSLYIADGHHRMAASTNVAQKRRE